MKVNTKELPQKELALANDTVLEICRSALERNFLSDVNKEHYRIKKGEIHKEQGWIQITKVPAALSEKGHARYLQWQNTIATLHSLNQKICYVLLREAGETELYLGAIPVTPGVKGDEARAQLQHAVSCQMPDIRWKSAEKEDLNVLKTLNCCGAVTGIPSSRKGAEHGKYQTMDQIAMGLRSDNEERDFAVVVIAEPIRDAQIMDTLRAMESYGSEIHSLTQYTSTWGTNKNSDVSVTIAKGVDAGVKVGTGVSAGAGIQGPVDVHVDKNFSIDANVGVSASKSINKGTSSGYSESVSQQHINKSAVYCEEILDKHIARMKAGRNLGLWKTGIYVLADSAFDVRTVMGTLRAVYSGDDTYIDPIRTMIMPADSGAEMLVHNFRHIPYPQSAVAGMFGSIFEDYATPMTTEEISIAAGLPEKEDGALNGT